MVELEDIIWLKVTEMSRTFLVQFCASQLGIISILTQIILTGDSVLPYLSVYVCLFSPTLTPLFVFPKDKTLT